MPPNIVLILTDQQRWDSLGCYGNPFVSTPNVDRLAAHGTVFQNAFTPYPVCTPARATMWTGLLPHEHGVIDNVYGIDDALGAADTVDRTVFDGLRAAGYETAYFGKWHLGEGDPGLFDHYDGFNSRGGHWQGTPPDRRYRPEVQTEACIDWLRDRAGGRPFMMVQSYYPPHNPFTAPEEFMDLYRARSIPFAGYYGAVSALDAYTGRILDTLDALGLADETIVVYYSDHGETFHYRRDGMHKFVCHDDAVRVPFVVRDPTRPAPREIEAFIGLEDITPTLLDWGGAEVPANLHGRSLVPLLRGETSGARASYYIQNHTNVTDREQRCLRTHEWKLILSDDGAGELFDLTDDPEEELNLYTTPRDDVHDQFVHLPSHDDRVIAMGERLREHAAAIGDDVGVRLAERAIADKRARAATAPGGAA